MYNCTRAAFATKTSQQKDANQTPAATSSAVLLYRHVCHLCKHTLLFLLPLSAASADRPLLDAIASAAALAFANAVSTFMSSSSPSVSQPLLLLGSASSASSASEPCKASAHIRQLSALLHASKAAVPLSSSSRRCRYSRVVPAVSPPAPQQPGQRPSHAWLQALHRSWEQEQAQAWLRLSAASRWRISWLV